MTNTTTKQTLSTQAKKIALVKQDKDYFFKGGKYEFYIVKQPTGGYFTECHKWCDRNLYTSSVDFSQDIVNLQKTKENIFCFLLEKAAMAAIEKIYHTNQ
jgi:hypothetical protein